MLLGREFFVQAHGSDLHLNLNDPIYRWITRFVLERARAVFYVTPNLRPHLDRYRSKLVYLPNPVAMPEADEAPTEMKDVLIFTRLHPVKGADVIFPAVERLSTMVRVTALDYGPLAPDYITRYGRWVTFVKPMPHDAIAAFIREFDVVIGQMRQGVLGLMEIESMAAGRAVIAAVNRDLYADDPPPVVAASTPADPYRLTRQTFRLARLPLPGPLAYPLAWLTTHVFLNPRGHTVRSVSASRAIETYEGPVLLIHGDADRVVPYSHLGRLERSARQARQGDPDPAPVEVLSIPGGEHSWLYEFASYRGTVARFLSAALAGPLAPDVAEAAARAVPATRLPQREHPFSAIEEEPGGVRTLLRAVRLAGGNRSASGPSDV